MEMIIKLFGMVLTFIPSVYLATYVIKKATEEQKFDLHLNRVKDKKGIIGVLIAYLNRISIWILITSIGVYLSTYFLENIYLEVSIVAFIVFIITYYFDNKNDI